jgi:hypothetical protein
MPVWTSIIWTWINWIEGYYSWQRLHASIDLLVSVDYDARLIAA